MESRLFLIDTLAGISDCLLHGQRESDSDAYIAFATFLVHSLLRHAYHSTFPVLQK